MLGCLEGLRLRWHARPVMEDRASSPKLQIFRLILKVAKSSWKCTVRSIKPTRLCYNKRDIKEVPLQQIDFFWKHYLIPPTSSWKCLQIIWKQPPVPVSSAGSGFSSCFVFPLGLCGAVPALRCDSTVSEILGKALPFALGQNCIGS